MKKLLIGLSMAAGMMFVAASAASAATFVSDASTVCAGGLCGTTTVITPHSVWGDVNASAGTTTAEWISYANTGAGGIIAPNATDRTRANATAVFTQDFAVGGPGDFDLWILADDTATVDLINLDTLSTTNLFTAFSGQINPCAPGGTGVPIGCVNADMGHYSTSGLLAGNYQLKVYAFQTNASVFGSEFAGSYSAVPEPAVWVLMIVGFAGLGWAQRRRMSALAA